MKYLTFVTVFLLSSVLACANLEGTPVPATPIATQISPQDNMVQVYVPEGQFLLGSPDSDTNAPENEKPSLVVRLDAFYIDRTEVTEAMYTQCMQAGSCSTPIAPPFNGTSAPYTFYLTENLPVIYVDWSQANAYCTWAGRRLPTEAEWEKAARGTNGRIYPWGNSQMPYMIGGDPPDPRQPADQNTGDVSPYGAMNMAGNVMEWVNDWYDAAIHATEPGKNPTGPLSGDLRVVRGDSGQLGFDRIAVRTPRKPDVVQKDTGFRCASSSLSLPTVTPGAPP